MGCRPAAGGGHVRSQRPRPRSPPVRPSRAAFRVAGASQVSLQRSVVPLGEDRLGSHEHQAVPRLWRRATGRLRALRETGGGERH
ncbi:hypothetical protein MC885_021515 [Smutsia gigantea]|nr:hypothetical protein MC885_021515 [Smutsia gigantea]